MRGKFDLPNPKANQNDGQMGKQEDRQLCDPLELSRNQTTSPLRTTIARHAVGGYISC